MWSGKAPNKEDEESLLPPLPTCTTTTPDIYFASSARWRSLPRMLLNALYQLLLFAIPSFLKRGPGQLNAAAEKFTQSTSVKSHSTGYLDGVRGLASFIVFIDHSTSMSYDATHSGYENSEKSSLWQLPVVRLVYSGPAMVSIFFVVSGFVLTHRFIQKMHRHEYETLFSGLASLTFRRALRLFLPALVSCLLVYVCASLDLMKIPKRVNKMKFHHGWPAFLSYLDEESNPWTWDMAMKGFYNPQLWSIAVEYRGSMIVFLVVLGLARCRTVIRIAVQSAIIVHAFGHHRWDVALFVAGMLIAELDVLVQQSISRKAFMQQKRIKFIFCISMFVGVWLGGFPRTNGLKSVGYTFSNNLWPFSAYRRRFWISVAAILIVGPMPYLPSVQGFFCTRLIRYLGKISFALYLVHGLGNSTIGTWLLHFTSTMLGNEGYWRKALGFAVSSVLYTPVVIWWSDMYWRAVDIPATHFAKWFEGKCASRVPS
ncbi:hypothetical protein PMZ80_005451 [Knufia obscura]|uniref:Acyltransferase 3 domain-containing protein n=2 Tax=Knufia TaxID=430999 RepID=A0AAN8F708_9EURO|nr:hypothetical protein PMZ80_005451 [Knufia obscura]KAK5958123.1 hypothetical protein OHC33_001313 [Knufia fluminis]